MVVLVAGISVVVAFSLGSSITFLNVPEKGVKVDTITKISPNVTEPDPAVFNKDAINPTIKTEIGAKAQ